MEKVYQAESWNMTLANLSLKPASSMTQLPIGIQDNMKITSIVLMLMLFPCLIQAQQPQVIREWLTVQPESSGAEFLMPFAPTAKERTLNLLAGQKITIKSQISVLNEKHTFVFSYHDHEIPKEPQAEDKALDGAVKGALGSTFGALESVSVVRVDGLNGREVNYTLIQSNKNKMRVASRYFLAGERLYQLSYIALNDDFDANHARKFLDSFKHVSKQ